MKFSTRRIGRLSLAAVASLALSLGLASCSGGTVGFMWVLGAQYSQIAGFKIDQFTGNLTQIIHSPFTSGGADPVSLVVRSGGRFVYVVNAGSPATATAKAGDANVSAFAVGGDGILTFQQSYATQGGTPVWVTTDSSGSYLYVLDRLDPTNAPVNGVVPATADGLGDITVFAIAPDTGRLSLVGNTQEKDATGRQLTYFRVGKAPTMIRASGTCLFTLDSGDQTIFPYATGTNGQLTLTANSTTVTNATRLTSINTTGGALYATDAGAPNSPGSIIPYTLSNGCTLATQRGGTVANLATAANPVYSLVDSRGKFLYVLNQSTTNTQNANSSISAFVIDQSTGTLIPVGDSANPYSVGSGPVCMVEDPSGQYLYISNFNDGTVTGKIIDQQRGRLSNLTRGSSFPATGQATCLAVSGATQ